MANISSRRTFVKQASLLVAGAYLTPWSKLLIGAENAVADTASGKVRGVMIETINVFKGIPYGAPTSGKNRFMPPVKPVAWTIDLADNLRWALRHIDDAHLRHRCPEPTGAARLIAHIQPCIVLVQIERMGERRPQQR